MPILSVCIPTYNRVRYLKELVSSLLPSIDVLPEGTVELVVSDNLSTDETACYCRSVKRPYFRFWTNETNIGGDRNFLKCIQGAKGEYVWLVGDDDVIPNATLSQVLKLVSEVRPGLLVLTEPNGCRDGSYASYGDFLGKCCHDEVGPALAHTLISANVFRHDCFDVAFAEQKLYTQYAHMFGLMKALSGRVEVRRGWIETRPVRADFAKYPSCLCVKQAIYMLYLAKCFKQPQFRRFAVVKACNLPIEYASRVKNWIVRRLRGSGTHRLLER